MKSSAKRCGKAVPTRSHPTTEWGILVMPFRRHRFGDGRFDDGL